MGKLDKKAVLITGGASGIGKAIALRFTQEGASVAIVDIDQAAAETLVEDIKKDGSSAIAVSCDVTNKTQVYAAVEKTVKAFGKLEILVNNAGVSPLKSMQDLDIDEWNTVIAINLTGPFLFMKASFDAITRAGKAGRVINMGSLAGQIGGIAVGLHYTASKGGIMAMSKQLAKLLAPYGATSNCIAPGTTDTPLVQAWPEATRQSLIEKIPLGRLGLPDDVASAALFFASEDAQFITGATINVNGGMFIG